jgi:hypothetical protein
VERNRKKKLQFLGAEPQAQAAVGRVRYHLSRLHTAPQFAAVLDCLFDLSPRRTDPIFEELVVVDDRLVFAGRRDQLVINLVGFVKHLGLGPREREFVLSRVDGIPRQLSR